MAPSPDMVLKALGYGVLVPAVVTAAGLALAARVGRAVVAALAVEAGLIAGLVALAVSKEAGWEFASPEDPWHWLPALALLATAAGVTDGGHATPRWAACLALSALTAWVLIRSEPASAPWWYAALGLSVFATWGLLARLVRRWEGAAPQGLLALCALAAGVILERSGILKFAQIAGVLGAVLIGCACVARWRPHPVVMTSAVPAFAVLFPGLLFVGFRNNFGDVPAASSLLALAAPLLLGATSLLPPDRLRPGWRAALGAGVVLVCLGAAVALAARP